MSGACAMPPLDVGALALHHGGGAELEASTSTSSCGRETALSVSADRDDDHPYAAPVESLRLRIGEDIDWGDVVGVGVGAVAVLERDGSTKGAAANPKSRRSAAARSSLSTSSAPPAPRALAAVVVIGGLLAKAARDHGRRRSPRCRLQLQLQLGDGARVFASGEGAGGRQQAEPGSPKVSCLGAVGVRSQPRTAAEGNGITSGGGGGRRWWAWLVADVLFRCSWKGRRPRGRPVAGGEPSRVE